MPSTLQKIQPLHAELVPPPNAVRAGATTEGKPLWREVTPRSRAVPDIDPETGLRRYRRNQMTGESITGLPLNKPEFYDEVRTYFQESDGQGNVLKVDYKAPTPEQIAAEERKKKIAQMRDHIPSALVDAGVEPEDLVSLLKRTESEAAGPATVEAKPTAEYPIPHGGGWWVLSNGQKMQGKRSEAIEAEAQITDEQRAAVRETKAVAAATPEH